MDYNYNNLEKKVRQENNFFIRFFYIIILFFISLARIFKYFTLIMFTHPGTSFTKVYPLTKKGYKISYVKHYSFVKQLRIGFVSSVAVAIIMSIISGLSMPSSQPLIASNAIACPVTDGGVGDSDGLVNGTYTMNASATWTPSGSKGDYWDCSSINLHITNNSTLTFSSVTASGLYGSLKVNNLEIDSGSIISSNSKGCVSSSSINGYGPNDSNICTQSTAGYGTGQTASSGRPTSGGGGYGGSGGDSYSGIAGGAIYGNYTEPLLYGSSGGYTVKTGDASKAGGTGGGIISLEVTGTLINNGKLSADGGSGGSGGIYTMSGGGSGGSIYIITTAYSGSGTLTVKGGNAGTYATYSGGGGSGGRIAVYYSSIDDFFNSADFDVAGGTSSYGEAGSSGSVYVKNTTTASSTIFYNLLINDTAITEAGSLIFDSAATISCSTSATTPSISATNLTLGGTYTCSPTTLTSLSFSGTSGFNISDGTTITATTTNSIIDFTLPAAGSTTWNNVTIAGGKQGYFRIDDAASISLTGTTTITANTQWTNLVDLNIGVGTSISSNASGCICAASLNGYGPTDPGNICTQTTAGYGTGQTVSSGNGSSGGGGNGGTGGNSTSSTSGGTTYNSITEPVLFGSSGGYAIRTGASSASAVGGTGGGLIRLDATGILTNNGALYVNGANGTTGGIYTMSGGGSGGSIYLSAGTCAGNGTITANGGNAGTYGITSGGGGGGGRIGLECGENNYSGSMSVTGGTSTYGSAGSDGTTSIIELASIPNTPTISSPENGAINQARNLTIAAGEYSGYGSHLSSEWQIATDADFNNVIWTSALDEANLTNIQADNSPGVFSGTHTGFTQLGYTTYYTRVRYTNSVGNSEWSSGISFTTINTAPSISSITAVQKTDGTGIVDVSFSLSDADSDVQNKVKIELNTGSGWIDPELDETDGNTTASQGDPKVENDNTYQIGNASGWITTAGGANTVNVDLAASNFTGIDSSTVQVRLTPNDQTVDGTPVTSDNFTIDRVAPTSIASFTNSVATTTSATFTWSPGTDSHFNHYEIWYGTNQTDVNNRNNTALEWDNDNDVNLTTSSASTTTITSLSSGLDYYAKICAQDNYSNELCADSISFHTNTLPIVSAVSASQAIDASGNVSISFTADDVEDQTLEAKIEYSINGGSNWSDPTLSSGPNINNFNEYQRNNISTVSGPQIVSLTWTAVTDILGTTDINNAKIKITLKDVQAGEASESSNFILDVVSPTTPGSFAVDNITSGQANLTWTVSTETNFNHYEIWYGTNETDVNNRNNTALEWDNSDDTDLATKSTVTTTINNLTSTTTYYFKICSQDNYGYENCSSSISETTGTPPIISDIAVSQKTNGSNIVDLSFVVDDVDNSDNIMARVEVNTGAGWQNATLDTTDTNTTAEFGDPKIDNAQTFNSQTYQVGTASGYTLTSFGVNRVHVDLLASNFTGINSSTVQVRVTGNDQGNNSTTVTSNNFIIDTTAPTTPGSFTKTTGLGNNAPLSWTAVTETNFNHYEIWYGTNETDVNNRNNSALEFDNIPDDINLGNIATNSTTLVNLYTNANYYAKICAVDNYGHEACNNTVIDFVANTPPSISDVAVAPPTDGSGKIKVTFVLADPDPNGNNLSTVVEYNLNDGNGWHKATVSDSSASYGTPVINNNNDFPISNLSGSSGNNTIQVFWNSQTDAPNQDISNVSLRVRTADVVETQTAPLDAPIIIDNIAPAGLTTFNASTYSSSLIRWNWNAVTENHFFRYEIWYGTNENDVNNRTGTAVRWDEGDDTALNTRTTIYTNITGLSENTIYYAKLFAKDTYVNETTLPSTSFKTNAFSNINTLTQSHSRKGDGLLTVNFNIGDYDTADNLRAAFQNNTGSGWHNGTVYLKSGSGVNIDNEASEQLLNITVPSGSKTISIIWDSSLDVPDAELNNAQLRLVPYDQIEVGSQALTASVLVDNIPPRGLTNLHDESTTSNSVTLNWAAVTTEPYFDHYEIWYGTNQNDVDGFTGSAQVWNADNDANLASVATSATTISNLVSSQSDSETNYYFKAKALDQAGNQTASAIITATPHNPGTNPIEHDPVFIGSLPNVAFVAGATTNPVFNLNNYFSHPDNLALIYSVSGQHHISVDINDGAVTFSAPDNFNGSESLTFYAIDSRNHSAHSNEIVVEVSEPTVIEPSPVNGNTNTPIEQEQEDIDYVLGTAKGRGIIKVIGKSGSALAQKQSYGVGGVIPRLGNINNEYYVFALKNKMGTTLHVYDRNLSLLNNKRLSTRLYYRHLATGNLTGDSSTEEIVAVTRHGASLYIKVYSYNPVTNKFTLLKRTIYRYVKRDYRVRIKDNNIVIILNGLGQQVFSWQPFNK